MMKGPIARSTISTSFVLALRLAIQTASLVAIARLLGASAFGELTGASSLAILLGALSNFGLQFVLLSDLSVDIGKRDTILRAAIPTTLTFGSILALLYLLICWSWLALTHVTGGALLAIAAAEFVFQPLLNYVASEKLALGKVAVSQFVTLAPLALRMMVIAAIYLLRPTDPVAFYAYGYLASAMVALPLCKQFCKPWPPPRDWTVPGRELLRRAWGHAASGLTSNGPSELDKTLATKLLAPTSAGIYAVASRVIGAITLPVLAMMLSSMPRLFRDAQVERGKVGRLLRAIFITSVIYSIAMSVVVWSLAPAIEWLFGKSYPGLGTSVRWLCIAILPLTLRIAAGRALSACGLPWMRVCFECSGVATLAFAAYSFAPSNPVAGMPVAFAASEWIMATIGWTSLIRAIRARKQRHPEIKP